MINKVTLIGNLGQDPEVRTLENGSKVARFSLATNENYKDKNGEWQSSTEWHNVVVWRDMAERAEKHLSRGMSVYVEGKISYRKYTDKDGVERTSTDITAMVIKSLEKKEPASNDTPKQAPAKAPPLVVNDSINGDDLPF